MVWLVSRFFPFITNPLDLLDLFFVTLRSPLDHETPLLTKTNKSSRSASTPWSAPEILSIKSARCRLERTYIASHSIFYLKLLRASTNRYHKFIAAAKKSLTPHLSSPPHPNRELFGKPSITSYTELQIALYPHHPLLLLYHSYMPNTYLINLKASFQPTNQHPLSPQLILPNLLPSSTPLFHSYRLFEIVNLLSQSSDSYSDLDPVPTTVLKKISNAISATILSIVNLCDNHRYLPFHLKIINNQPNVKETFTR